MVTLRRKSSWLTTESLCMSCTLACSELCKQHRASLLWVKTVHRLPTVHGVVYPFSCIFFVMKRLIVGVGWMHGKNTALWYEKCMKSRGTVQCMKSRGTVQWMQPLNAFVEAGKKLEELNYDVTFCCGFACLRAEIFFGQLEWRLAMSRWGFTYTVQKIYRRVSTGFTDN